MNRDSTVAGFEELIKEMAKNKTDTAGIDRIIDLVKRIADALTKSDFLPEKEKRQLESYQSCELKIGAINDNRKLRHQSPLSEDEQRQIESKHNYEPNNAATLKSKLSTAQAEHIKSIIKLQEELDLYLAPRWPEILTLKTPAYPLQKEIEYFINADFGVVNKNVVSTTAKNLKRELKRVKARLEYTQTQTPETRGQGDKPAGAVQVKSEPTDKTDSEKPVRIEAAIQESGVKVSHNTIKQAAQKKEIHSKRSGSKKNSPYLVYTSEIKEKFGTHGTK